MRILLTPYGESYGKQSSLHDETEITQVRRFAVSADINTTMQLAYILIERGDVTAEDLDRTIRYRSFDPII